MHSRLRILAMIAVLLADAGTVFAQDHPLVTSYPGSTITKRNVKEFDEYELPVGPLKKGKFEKVINLEGKISIIGYYNPVGRSTLEIMRNYQTALESAGFQKLFSCKNAECGEGSENTKTLGYFYPGARNKDERYWVGKLARSEGDVYVAVYVSEYNRVTWLNVAEVKAMQTKMVTVNAASLSNDLNRTGHVAIYGIYYDTDSAEIKSESGPVLSEIGKVLSQNPALKLYVVGHTDNQGDLAHNLDLSLRRAQSVVKALSAQPGASSRLKAQGVGPLSPVAGNDSEEGRAKNRRVELVKQ